MAAAMARRRDATTRAQAGWKPRGVGAFGLATAAFAAFCAPISAQARAAVIKPPAVPAGQPVPVARPYDESADAHAVVAAAFSEARRSGRTVLIDFGANWCPDCRMLAGMLDEAQVAPWVAQHFVVAMVDVGRFNKNMDIAAKYGVTVKAIPAVLEVTPDGRLKDPDGAKALGDARTMSTASVVDLLASWDSH